MITHLEKTRNIIGEIKKVVIGKDDIIYKVLMAILAKGHILIEDIPGVGKTTLALAFSKAMVLEEHRMQFTPDVLPTDVVGFTVLNESGGFEYKQGAILCNLFLADEINRTSSKTQSALLEVMEEGKVTVDSITRPVPQPFVVIATQNPIGSVGTQMLPESQLDRFMVKLTMGYPDIKSEIDILKGKHNNNPMDNVESIVSIEELLEMQAKVETIFIRDNVYDYIAGVIAATRSHDLIQLGVSPRGTIALTKMAMASAFLNDRDFVTPGDVAGVFIDTAAHRILLKPKARVNHVTVDDVLKEIISKIKAPKMG